MKKNALILFLIILITNCLFSEEKETILIKRFSLGSEKEQLGFKKEYLGTGEPYGPRAVVVVDSTFQVLDIYNSRIAIYDLEGKYLDEITLKHPDAFLFSIIMKANDKYCFYETNEGIGVFTNDGYLAFNIPEKRLSDQVKYSWNFFLLKDNLILYNSTKKNNIDIYNDNGEMLNEEEVMSYINDVYKLAIYDNNKLINDTVIAFAKNNGLLVVDSKLVSGDFEIHRKLFTILQKNIKMRDNKSFEKEIFQSIRLIGFDNNSNSYWSCRLNKNVNRFMVIICSKYGQIIDYFDNPLNERRVAVSENGDLYYLHVFKGGIELWKTKRSW